MRVLLISAYRISGLIGGVSRFTLDIFSEASKLGHHITIVERGPVGARVIHQLDEITDKKRNTAHFWYNVPKLLGMVHNLFVILTAFLKSLNLIRRENFDLVICDEIGLSGFTGWILNKIYHLPYVLQVFGWPKECSAKTPIDIQILSPIRKKIIQSAERAIFPYQGGEACFLRLGANEAKLKLLPLGVSLSRFQRDDIVRKETRTWLGVKDDTIVIGYVGRLSKEKGVKMVMDVISAMHTHYNKDKLLAVIVGTGPEEEIMKETAKRMKLNCVFVGQSNKPEIWLSGMDIFLALSQRETFGLACAEAMSCQLPVIATNIPAFERLIKHGQSGFLVEYGNIEKCAQLLSTLFEDPKLVKEFGIFARNQAEKFSVEKSVKELFEELNKVVH